MLCNGDKERPFRIDFMETRKDGAHKLIGSVTTTIAAGFKNQKLASDGSAVECV